MAERAEHGVDGLAVEAAGFHVGAQFRRGSSAERAGRYGRGSLIAR